MKKITALILLLVLASCSKNKGPEGVLSSYINTRFSSGIEQEKFDNYFTGELLEQMNQLGENEIEKINSIKQSSSHRLKISYKRCTDDNNCYLTYTLSYLTEAVAGDSKSNVEVNIKKIARLVKNDKMWRIKDISDVKTHFNYKTIK